MPAWWADLARTDLPDDPEADSPRARVTLSSPPPRQERLTVPRLLEPVPDAPPQRGRERLGNTMVLVMVVVAAVVVTWVGMGDPSPRGMLVVLLVFGIPMALTLAVVSVVARRHTH